MDIYVNSLQKNIIVVAYIPPYQPSKKYSSFCSAVDEILSSCIHYCSTIVNNPPVVAPTGARHLLDISMFYLLKQSNHITNINNVILDLVFSSPAGPTQSVEPADILVPVDLYHPALSIELPIYHCSKSLR